MGTVVRIEIERAERESVSQPGTVRARDRYPMDVELIDLSVSGALLASRAPIPVGTLITIGIPGIGMHAARISRVDGEQMACAFFPALDPGAVRKAKVASTLLKGDFDKLPVPIPGVGPADEAPDTLLPLPNRRLDRLVARLKRKG
jgi:hypothetical protein